MIALTRLSGSVFVLNSDLIERVDSAPDTVISLVDGTKYVVAETLEEVVASIRRHRAELISLSHGLADRAAEPPRPARRLMALSSEDWDDEPRHGTVEDL